MAAKAFTRFLGLFLLLNLLGPFLPNMARAEIPYLNAIQFAERVYDALDFLSQDWRKTYRDGQLRHVNGPLINASTAMEKALSLADDPTAKELLLSSYLTISTLTHRLDSDDPTPRSTTLSETRSDLEVAQAREKITEALVKNRRTLIFNPDEAKFVEDLIWFHYFKADHDRVQVKLHYDTPEEHQRLLRALVLAVSSPRAILYDPEIRGYYTDDGMDPRVGPQQIVSFEFGHEVYNFPNSGEQARVERQFSDLNQLLKSQKIPLQTRINFTRDNKITVTWITYGLQTSTVVKSYLQSSLNLLATIGRSKLWYTFSEFLNDKKQSNAYFGAKELSKAYKIKSRLYALGEKISRTLYTVSTTGLPNPKDWRSVKYSQQAKYNDDLEILANKHTEAKAKLARSNPADAGHSKLKLEVENTKKAFFEKMSEKEMKLAKIEEDAKAAGKRIDDLRSVSEVTLTRHPQAIHMEIKIKIEKLQAKKFSNGPLSPAEESNLVSLLEKDAKMTAAEDTVSAPVRQLMSEYAKSIPTRQKIISETIAAEDAAGVRGISRFTTYFNPEQVTGVVIGLAFVAEAVRTYMRYQVEPDELERKIILAELGGNAIQTILYSADPIIMAVDLLPSAIAALLNIPIAGLRKLNLWHHENLNVPSMIEAAVGALTRGAKHWGYVSGDKNEFEVMMADVEGHFGVTPLFWHQKFKRTVDIEMTVFLAELKDKKDRKGNPLTRAKLKEEVERIENHVSTVADMYLATFLAGKAWLTSNPKAYDGQKTEASVYLYQNMMLPWTRTRGYPGTLRAALKTAARIYAEMPN